MEHSTFRRRLAAAAFIVLFSVLASGCGFFGGHTFSDIFGEERTLPDGDEVDFSNRHSPILNPGNTPVPVADPADQPHTTLNIPAHAGIYASATASGMIV